MPFPKFTPKLDKLDERHEGLKAQPNTKPTPPDATPWEILKECAEDIAKRIEATAAPFFAVEVDGVGRLSGDWPPVNSEEDEGWPGAPHPDPVEFLRERFEIAKRFYPASRSVRVGVQCWEDHFETVAEVRRDGDGWRLEVFERNAPQF